LRGAGYALRGACYGMRGSNFSNSVYQSCPPYEALNTKVSFFIKLATLVAKSRADISAG